MDFIDDIRAFADKVQMILPHIKTEEATKHSVILPFLQILGYNVFDPSEVVPEFTADVGTKKGEKVDYAILVNGKPAILIEAKAITDSLHGHDSQLFRYFTTTTAKFAILTNGLVYKFYSDLQEPNKLDADPFLEFSLADCRESIVTEVKRFHKENFNVDLLFSSAANFKYSTQIRGVLEAEFREPSEEFLRLLLKDVHTGKFTQNVLDKFRPLVKRTVAQYFNDMFSDKLKSAIETTMQPEHPDGGEQPGPDVLAIGIESAKPKIVTTVEEMEAFYVIKSILREHVDAKRITYKDTASYFSVLLDNNVRKWLCRLYVGGTKRSLAVQGADKTEVWIDITSIDDLFQHRQVLIDTVVRIAGSPKQAERITVVPPA